MNDHAGDSGGGSTTPTPDIEFVAVEMETASVSAFGDALIKDAANLKTAAGDVNKQLVDPGMEGTREAETGPPVGADPRQETLHSLITTHSERMIETRRFLENAALAVENLGKVSQIIVSQFGDTDALNATSIDQVKGLIEQTTREGKLIEVTETGDLRDGGQES